MKKPEDNNLVFDNGKGLELNVGYSGLSLSPDGELSSGYDDRLYGREMDMLTPEERKEIAWYMMTEWLNWGFGDGAKVERTATDYHYQIVKEQDGP